MAIAQVGDVRDLDRHCPRHLLARDLPIARRFESILQDGYDPIGIRAPPADSLLAHVAGKAGYKATRTVYVHPLWNHLAERAPHWRSRETWLATQLSRHRILRVEPTDEWRAIELGLMPDPDLHWDPPSPPPLDLQAHRFSSLDGLLLLLLLYREAQDAAHTDRAARLKAALYDAALDWAVRHRYEGEVLDTWRFLIASRMVAWEPRFEPDPELLRSARAELLSEQTLLGEPKGSRGPLAPEKLKPRTRSERRWRRRVWMRACRLHYDRAWRQPNFDYRDTCPVFEWVVAHRAVIDAHRTRAIELLLDYDEGPIRELAPLTMPEDVHNRRKRPMMSEEEWRVFGDTSVYDVIPVVKE